MLDPRVRQRDGVRSTAHPSPVVGLNGIEVVVCLRVGDGVLVAVGNDLVGVNLTVTAASSPIGDGLGGVCDGDMVVGRGSNNRSGMGNYRGGMGNNCWCVMVVNSQGSCLGNRGVHGNGGRGSVDSGVASDPMADMANPMGDMANSVGDNSGCCMHSGMPDPVRDNWSNGNSRGN